MFALRQYSYQTFIFGDQRKRNPIGTAYSHSEELPQLPEWLRILDIDFGTGEFLYNEPSSSYNVDPFNITWSLTRFIPVFQEDTPERCRQVIALWDFAYPDEQDLEVLEPVDVLVLHAGN